MDQQKLVIKIEKKLETANYLIIDFFGNLDKYGLGTVKNQIEELAENSGKKYLVFNFKKLEFINSESIGFLLTVHAKLVKKNATLVVVEASHNVKEVLEVIGLFKLINYFESSAAFEGSLSKN